MWKPLFVVNGDIVHRDLDMWKPLLIINGDVVHRDLVMWKPLFVVNGDVVYRDLVMWKPLFVVNGDVVQRDLVMWKPLVVIFVVVDGDAMEEHVEAVGRRITEVAVGTAMREDNSARPAEVTPTLGARHLVTPVDLLQEKERFC